MVVFIVISYVFFFFTSFPTYGTVIQWTLCLSINYSNFTGPVPCHIKILIKFRISSSNMNFQVNFCFSSIITFILTHTNYDPVGISKIEQVESWPLVGFSPWRTGKKLRGEAGGLKVKLEGWEVKLDGWEVMLERRLTGEVMLIMVLMGGLKNWF